MHRARRQLGLLARASLALPAVLALAAAPSAHGHLTLPKSSGSVPQRTILTPLGGYPPETPYSLALHMHASFSEQSGSIEWHTEKADSIGCDVIWWTEHDWRLTNFRHMNKYTFEDIHWDSLFRRWSEPDDQFIGQFRYWADEGLDANPLLSSDCDTLAAQGSHSLRMHIVSAPGEPAFVSGHLIQTTSEIHNKYSLVKRPVVSFAVFPEVLEAANAKFFFEAELSDHPEGTHILRYVAGSLDGEAPGVFPLTLVPGQWNVVTLDLLADARARFTTGPENVIRAEDDSFNFARIGLASRDGAKPVVFFDDYEITPDSAWQGNVVLDRAREMGEFYESQTPSVTHFFGSEISKFKAQPHLNAYAPNHLLIDYGSHVYTDSLYYAIEQVHDQDGAVSFNHVFGPQFYHSFVETPEQHALRMLFVKRGQVRSRALGVDMFEIGYRLRGAMNLAEHFELWDVLTGNAIFVTGNGVSDSHGRGQHNLVGWGPSEIGITTINNFVTWLWTEDFSEAGFVRAMKSGRAYFGDPYRWKGTLDVHTTDGFRMGQVVVTDRDTHELVVSASNLPDGSIVRMKQMEIRESPPVEYMLANMLRDEVLTDETAGDEFSATTSLDVTTPSFVRVEVTAQDGKEWVFSNPIHFVREVPLAGVGFGRVAARWEDLRLFRADRAALRAAEYSALPRTLVLALDEEPAGQGSFMIDCGGFGMPDVIQGAQNTVFSAGVLTLSGFNGTGSSVTLGWGVTAVELLPAKPSEVRLDPVRPNPFRRFAVATLHLPGEAKCRVEVVDVGGRVVRALVDGAVGEGARTLYWDGISDGGKRAADGVYFLRAIVDGRAHVRKFVKIQ